MTGNARVYIYVMWIVVFKVYSYHIFIKVEILRFIFLWSSDDFGDNPLVSGVQDDLFLDEEILSNNQVGWLIADSKSDRSIEGNVYLFK